MEKFLKLMSSHSMRLLFTIIFTFLVHGLIPLHTKKFYLSVSLSMKEILMFMIPLIIFSSVYSAFSKIRGRAIYLVSLLLGAIILSNFLSVGIAGIFGYFVLFTNNAISHHPQEIVGLTPLWQFTMPKLVSNNIILLLSFILACINQPILEKYTNKMAKLTTKIVEIFLGKFFTPLLPVFIFGFLLKLLNDDIIGDVLAVNPAAFLFMILTLLAYLLIIFTAAVIFYKKNPKEILKNLAAPAITAFTTMSSAAALPFSIKAAEKNTGNKQVSDIVMPATVNIHMIGDSICIPVLAMIILAAFGHPMPTLTAYLIFAASFVVTKFSGAGVPGGSVLVMIPVLENYLGFNSEMTALITICYILLDPICTTGNVVGNNLFVIHFNKLYGWIKNR